MSAEGSGMPGGGCITAGEVRPGVSGAPLFPPVVGL